MNKHSERRILPIIIFSQFFCTSVWFAGNAIMPDIVANLHLQPGFLAHLISAVQFGFISGTLVFAVLTISDRFPPSRVFFVSAVLAGLFNLATGLDNISSAGLLLCRFFIGFFLAGIYPVGMKIASDYYQKGLGRSLGFLVGALVVGTAFPHLLKSIPGQLPWKFVIYTTSGLSAIGGLIMLLLVPNGPYRKAGQKPDVTAFLAGFKNKNFRSAALGYFGHMWELYSFWTFLPVMLTIYKNYNTAAKFNVSLLTFLIIAAGGVSCVLSGLLSLRFGPKNIAAISLFLSGMCCLLSPLLLSGSSIVVLLLFFFFWGMVVVSDSPLFSTIIAQSAPEESRGTSLTIVNCIGFSITIVSIQLVGALLSGIDPRYVYMILAAGPVLGLIALLKGKGASLPGSPTQ
jgi:MFS family permease